MVENTVRIRTDVFIRVNYQKKLLGNLSLLLCLSMDRYQASGYFAGYDSFAHFAPSCWSHQWLTVVRRAVALHRPGRAERCQMV